MTRGLRRHRRPPLHKVLGHQRRHVNSKAKSLAATLQHSASPGGSHTRARELERVASTLAALRKQVVKEGGHSRTAKRAARGLEQLESSYIALAKAEKTADVKTRVALIKHSVQQVNAANCHRHRRRRSSPAAVRPTRRPGRDSSRRHTGPRRPVP